MFFVGVVILIYYGFADYLLTLAIVGGLCLDLFGGFFLGTNVLAFLALAGMLHKLTTAWFLREQNSFMVHLSAAVFYPLYLLSVFAICSVVFFLFKIPLADFFIFASFGQIWTMLLTVVFCFPVALLAKKFFGPAYES